MNLKEAIRENQKRYKLYRIIRRCVTTTEIMLRNKKNEEEQKRKEILQKQQTYKKTKYHAYRKSNSKD